MVPTCDLGSDRSDKRVHLILISQFNCTKRSFLFFNIICSADHQPDVVQSVQRPSSYFVSKCQLHLFPNRENGFLYLLVHTFKDANRGLLMVELFLNGPCPASFSFILGLFKQTIQFSQQINVKKVSIRYWDMNS